MKILNTEKEDYHVHSMNYSDGFNTIDEIVRFAGEIGMKKVVICDHSQASIEAENLTKKTPRSISHRWKNVHNDVEVLFGVEADLLNEEGDICSDIQGFELEDQFTILSLHIKAYKGDKKKITEGFVKAIERHHKKINAIGHVLLDYGMKLDAEKIVEAANKYKIPIELNCRYFTKDPIGWKKILKITDQVYVNSDAHTLWELKERRKEGFKFLKENGLI